MNTENSNTLGFVAIIFTIFMLNQCSDPMTFKQYKLTTSKQELINHNLLIESNGKFYGKEKTIATYDIHNMLLTFDDENNLGEIFIVVKVDGDYDDLKTTKNRICDAVEDMYGKYQFSKLMCNSVYEHSSVYVQLQSEHYNDQLDEQYKQERESRKNDV